MINCRSREGAWIEIVYLSVFYALFGVAPVRERGLKLTIPRILRRTPHVAPVRERGLKFVLPAKSKLSCVVAPVRERGLK